MNEHIVRNLMASFHLLCLNCFSISNMASLRSFRNSLAQICITLIVSKGIELRVVSNNRFWSLRPRHNNWLMKISTFRRYPHWVCLFWNNWCPFTIILRIFWWHKPILMMASTSASIHQITFYVFQLNYLALFLILYYRKFNGGCNATVLFCVLLILLKLAFRLQVGWRIIAA